MMKQMQEEYCCLCCLFYFIFFKKTYFTNLFLEDDEAVGFPEAEADAQCCLFVPLIDSREEQLPEESLGGVGSRCLSKGL